MSEKENEKNYVVTTCRVPKDLHTAVSRKLAGKLDTFQSIMIQALEEYVRPSKRLRIVAPDPSSSEHAQLGSQLLESLPVISRQHQYAPDPRRGASVETSAVENVQGLSNFALPGTSYFSDNDLDRGSRWKRRP